MRIHELQAFTPAGFPAHLRYDGSESGVAHRDTKPMFDRLQTVERKTPFPRAIIQDSQIRGCMEQAVTKSEVEIQEITKFLEVATSSITEILTIALIYPNEMPTSHTLGNNNPALKSFAFDAYESLSGHFGNRQWSNWCIVPYFRSGNDAQDIFQLGVFVTEDFNETVVE